MSQPTPPPTASRLWLSVAAYGAMLAAAIGLFFVIRSYGETLSAPAPEPGTTPGVGAATGKGHALFHVLLALIAVIALGQLLGRAFRYIGQPPVIGEVVAGILLGPSLLGRLSPEAMTTLLPPESAPHLGVVAQLGAILYMFIVGLELNTGQLRSIAQSVLAVSHLSIVLPFVLGAALALWLYPVLSNSAVPFTSFALFVGVAMAITAFPVLARILTDRGIDKTALGVTALGAAAVGDVTAWCLLALVVGVAKAQVGDALLVILWAALFVAAMLLVVRPLVAAYVRRKGDAAPSRGTIAIVIIGVLLAALTTEGIGIHAVFGAFLLGALIPHDSRLARDIGRKLYDVVTVLLLPAFFAYTGLRTQIGLVSSGAEWAMCAAIVLVATAGKFGGAFLAARATGHGWRAAAAVGSLMNTRGLMELIILNIGLDLGVISPTLFAMMVVMALVTTMVTAPALHFLMPDLKSAPVDEAEPPKERLQPVRA
ncbi:MAG TPA: cation:proton antiporter [Gemmataceae bacterium]|nr:cation:proton antiporter [Gemmataceae bacterium]